MKRTFTHLLLFLLILTGVFDISNPNSGLAVGITILDETFTRKTGAPDKDTVNFNIPVARQATLRIINGGGNGPGTGNRVSSAVITLNGQTVVGPNQLNQNVAMIEVPVNLRAGANTLEVELKGSPGGFIQVSISALAVSPPTANFTAIPQTGDAPLTVNFDATGSTDPDLPNDTLKFDWDFGDGSMEFGETVVHTYLNSGNFTAELTVTDSFGLTDKMTAGITVTTPDIADPLPDTTETVPNEPEIESVIATPELTAPNTTDVSAPARTAISPYVQVVPNDSYTFMAFSHPSLSTAKTQIGVIVEVLGMATVPDDTGGASVNFTIDAGDTHRVFVVNLNHDSIFVGASAFSDSRTHIITTQDSSQFGNIRVLGINEAPMVPDADGKFDNVSQISMWGVVFIPSSGTGFAMEFVGDAHDSTITPDTHNDALTATEALSGSTGAARGIN